MFLTDSFSSLTEVKNACVDDTAGGKSKRSRAEKKSRKAMQKLGMKPVTDVTRVTIKKSKDVRLHLHISIFFQLFSAHQAKHPLLQFSSFELSPSIHQK